MPISFGFGKGQSIQPEDFSILDKASTHFDASKASSYAGSGTTVSNLKNPTQTATLRNGATWSPDFGGMFVFDGSNDDLLANYNIGISGDAAFSISTWVRTGNVPNDWVAIVNNDIALASYRSVCITMYGNRPALDFCNSRWRADTALQTNTWYHIVVTKSPGNISTTTKIYVNGVVVSASLEGGEGPVNIQDAPLVLGRLNASAGRYFNGNIAALSIYNSTLSQNEVSILFKKQMGRFGVVDVVAQTPDIAQTGRVLHFDGANTSSNTGSGNVWYNLAGSAHATFYNATSRSEDGGGSFVVGTGNNSYATLATSLAPGLAVRTGDFSISLWFKMGSLTGGNGFQMMISQFTTWTSSLDFGLRFRTDLSMFSFLAADSVPLFCNSGSNAITSTSVWYNACIVRTSGVTQFYLNNVATNSSNVVGDIKNSATNLYIGTNITNDEPMRGSAKIGHFVFYNRALTSTERTDNFNNLKTRFGL